jgi:hypothetical protein
MPACLRVRAAAEARGSSARSAQVLAAMRDMVNAAGQAIAQAVLSVASSTERAVLAAHRVDHALSPALPHVMYCAPEVEQCAWINAFPGREHGAPRNVLLSDLHSPDVQRHPHANDQMNVDAALTLRRICSSCKDEFQLSDSAFSVNNITKNCGVCCTAKSACITVDGFPVCNDCQSAYSNGQIDGQQHRTLLLRCLFWPVKAQLPNLLNYEGEAAVSTGGGVDRVDFVLEYHIAPWHKLLIAVELDKDQRSAEDVADRFKRRHAALQDKYRAATILYICVNTHGAYEAPSQLPACTLSATARLMVVRSLAMVAMLDHLLLPPTAMWLVCYDIDKRDDLREALAERGLPGEDVHLVYSAARPNKGEGLFWRYVPVPFHAGAACRVRGNGKKVDNNPYAKLLSLQPLDEMFDPPLASLCATGLRRMHAGRRPALAALARVRGATTCFRPLLPTSCTGRRRMRRRRRS